MINGGVIRIGTRGSRLALAQTELVIGALRARFPEAEMETVILTTKGDKLLDRPLVDFGGKGAFITELEEALQQGRIDLAVHSAKDMPMEMAAGLGVAGVLPRGDIRDVLVTRKQNPQAGHNMVIGTGSLRRQCQLALLYPSVECMSIRGNVPTRLQKLRDGVCQGVVLAAAGLERLALLHEPDLDYLFLEPEEMLPAGGQGIIAVEGRIGDRSSEMAAEISDETAALELETERYVLQLLNAGCHEAVGTLARVQGDKVTLQILREIQGVTVKKQGEAELGSRHALAQQLVSELKISTK